MKQLKIIVACQQDQQINIFQKKKEIPIAATAAVAARATATFSSAARHFQLEKLDKIKGFFLETECTQLKLA
jgi:hypothetical protein